MLPPPYTLIDRELRMGRVVPFLGAGASLIGRAPDQHWESPQTAFLPTGGELSGYLATLTSYPGDPRELPRVAQYYDEMVSRTELDNELHSVFARMYEPGALHQYLASFDGLLIVTTNYDSLLERAYGDRPYHLVIYNTRNHRLIHWKPGATAHEETVPSELDIPDPTVPVIFKMHGSPDHQTQRERDSYVITEDDYIEFLARMAGESPIPAAFAERFKRNRFLFLGYSLADWNLRVILHKIWKDWRHSDGQTASNPMFERRQSWAIQYRPQALEEEFWRARDVKIFDLKIEDFMTNLLQVGTNGADAATHD